MHASRWVNICAVHAKGISLSMGGKKPNVDIHDKYHVALGYRPVCSAVNVRERDVGQRDRALTSFSAQLMEMSCAARGRADTEDEWEDVSYSV